MDKLNKISGGLKKLAIDEAEPADAGVRIQNISDKDRKTFINNYKESKGKARGKHKVGDHVSYGGKNWYLYDARAASGEPGGILWILISPNARQFADFVPDNEVTWEPWAGKKTAAKEKKTYVTTFCNFPHDVNTGRPINHECYILPPAALKAEMEGDYETAQEILHKNRGKMRMVNPRKTKDASIKTAEEQIYHVALDNIEWDTDDDEVNLPSHLTGKTRASSEEEAIERIIERASDNYDYLIFDAEAKAIIYKPKKASTKKTAAEPNHKALLDFVEKDVEESLVNVQKALKKVNDMATEQGIFELIEKEMGIVNKSLYNAVQNILKVELIIAQKVEGKK